MANLIFDYDGTIHNTLKIYEPSFRKAYEYLVSTGKAEPREIPVNEISCWLGFSGAEMWKRFQPNLEQEYREKARQIIGDEMVCRLESGEGELFEGTKEVLRQLKADGHRIIFLSNCRIKYQQMHTKVFGLDEFFDDFYPAERYDFIPKCDIFPLFRDKYDGEYIMIGDRFHDMEVATKNNLKFIGCAYGYGSEGELDHADAIVDDIRELPQIIDLLGIEISDEEQ